MNGMSLARRARVGTLALGLIALATAASAEELLRTSVESRVLAGFRVAEEAAAEQLPDGWAPLTLPQGPLAGANMMLVFMDRALVLDAGGVADTEASRRAVAVLVYGVSPEADRPRAFITAIYETPPMMNSYGNSHAAAIRHGAMTEGASDAPTEHAERWQVTAEAGGEIVFEYSYETGVPVWVTDAESQPYSAANPDVFHIYRYDQLADLVMNTTIGRDIAGDVSHSVSVPELADAFDGTEALVAVINVPVYLREVYDP